MFDYSKKLLPRAVSYSKGLLEYFFRGGLVGLGPCGNPVAEFSSTWYPFTVGQLSLGGLSNETAGAGELRVVVYYTIDDVTSFVVSDPIQVDFNTEVGDVDFQFHGGVPFNGAVMPTGRYMVFKGQLGKESGAVVVGNVLGLC